MTIPTLTQIQQAIEQSWKEGFDPRGAQHYRSKIVGKSCWIGAAEVASVMSYWGQDATVIQFIKCRESRALLPKFVKEYFLKKLGKEGCPFCSVDMRSEASSKELLQFASMTEDVHIESACDCPLLPLYLQWEGHSVSIVGIETVLPSNDLHFLVFDPLKNGTSLKTTLSSNKTLAPLRLSCKKLLGKDAQLILCSTRSLSPSEKSARRRSPPAVTAAEDAVDSL
jgi:hypothetical protein